MAWPPALDELKTDMRLTTGDQDDARLQQVLDASVAFVQCLHAGVWAFGDPFALDADGQPLDDPPADIVLGTLRLAGRWHTRRRSPDALIAAGDLGTSRIPSFDADIDRLLRIGRHRRSVIA